MKTDQLPMLSGICTMLIISRYIASTQALDLGSCKSPLGMESGAIPDSAIHASSAYVTNVAARYARLRKEMAGGAWCPKSQIENGVREWLEIDLEKPHMITAIETQGRYYQGIGQEYVEEYMLEYRRADFPEWRPYKKRDGSIRVLVGNSDTSTVVTRELVPPIFATKIRVLPHSIHRRTVCLRIDLKGCRDQSGILSYTVPESSVAQLTDVFYDGLRQYGILSAGLGSLIDGEIGLNDYQQELDKERGTGWVAWMRDNFPDDYVELIFYFDAEKVFDAVHIYTNNFFSRDVKVFSRAKLWFGDNDKFDETEPVIYTYIPDTILENARNVSIALHDRIGSVVKIHLYFAAQWLIISEVTFESTNPFENVTESLLNKINAGDIHVNHEVDPNLQTITAREDGQEYVEMLIGVLTAITLLLLLVFVVILLLSRRQKLQSSPTVLKNPFEFAINMKDFLLNLTPARMLDDKDRVSPDAPEDFSVHESLTMEQFNSPLVESQYKSTYAVVSNNDSMREIKSDEALKEKVSIHLESKSEHTVTTPSCSSSPAQSPARQSHNYRTLQNYANNINRPNVLNMSSVRKDIDYASMKRWHTAPKDKHKVPAPVVTWNIAPSMNKPYKAKEMEPKNIPRESLETMEKLGYGHIGEVVVCSTTGLSKVEGSDDVKLVVARIPHVSSEDDKVDSGTDTMREVRFLSCLSDPNIARVLGICTADPAPWTIIEYTELGDLAHYLQYSEPLTTSQRPSLNFLSQSCLLYMGMQIASGMRFLESKNLVHKDLAARNCLLGRFYTVKVTDIAMCSNLYKKDYCDIGGRPLVPIRWQPWESILLDRYTCSSTVWSFAVTLWEIMCFAREKPFQHLSNEQVVQNAEIMYYGEELKVFLPKPMMCPDEVYKMMCSCWRRDESYRPAFKEIHTFLKAKTEDYRPGV